MNPSRSRTTLIAAMETARCRAACTALILLLIGSPVPGLAQASAQEPPTPKPGDRTRVAIPGTGLGFELGYVPGGTFEMGSPDVEEGRRANEGPRSPVTVSPFWMGIHEVRYDEYAAFRFVDRDADSTAAAGRTYRAEAAPRPSPPYEDPAHGLGNEGHPAAGMTQWGALQYARWLWEKTGQFFRLPTEAEWEFACRAGGDGAPPSAVQLDRAAWFIENSAERFHPVGSKRANAWGIHDLLGNVAEWTLDQYTRDYFERIHEEGTTDPWIMPESLHPRTVRGGAFDDEPDALRCTARLESSLNWKRRDPQIPKSYWWNTDSPFLGFRLVRPVAQPSREEAEEFFALVLGES